MFTTSMLHKTLGRFGQRTPVCFRIVFADGSRYQNRERDPDVEITVHRPRAERQMLLFGHIGLLESYFQGDIDIEGDLPAAFRSALDSNYASGANPLLRMRNLWHELRFSNRSVAQARANARFHYGLGEQFFRYWLDREGMMYTCAYWKEGTRTIEEAQRNKIEHVCRKLRLEPGESVVDVGCGWGGFMFYAREQYGVRVTGINTTTEQVNELHAEIERRGLQDELSVHERDHREVPPVQFDKVAHIGVLEHAGRHHLRAGIRALADYVKPGGLGVLHFIGHVGRFETEFYVRKHIFPGGWIPSLSQTIEIMEQYGLEILDIENLRRHYALTLDAWGERFDQHWEEIHALDPRRFDETFRRKWRTYLWACAEMFRSHNGYTHLFQIVFSKGNVGYDYPMSRAFLYAGEAPSARRAKRGARKARPRTEESSA